MKSVIRSFVPVVSVLALFACNRTDRTVDDRVSPRDPTGLGAPLDREHAGMGDKSDKHGTTTITGANVGGVLNNESAIEKIVAARCARETSCNNVGGDKRFTSPDVCTQNVRTDMRDDLKTSECPRGIDAKELNECLESIRTESCTNPIDTISRLAACRTSDLCLSADTTNR